MDGRPLSAPQAHLHRQMDHLGRSRAIRFQGERSHGKQARQASQDRQVAQAIDHTIDQDRELDAVVVSYSPAGPLPCLPAQDFAPFGSGLGVEGFDKMFDGFTRFATRAMTGSASTPSPTSTPPPLLNRDVPSTSSSPQKGQHVQMPSTRDHQYTAQDYHLDRPAPLPPHPTRAYTAPALAPINTQMEEDDFIPVFDAESSTDHSTLTSRLTLHIPHGSLSFPVPRPYMRPRAQSTSAIGSPNETVESVISPASGYSQYISDDLPPLLPTLHNNVLRSQSARPERQSSHESQWTTGDSSDPTPPDSVFSVHSQIPFTGYTDDHIVPLGSGGSGGYDPSQLSIPSLTPPRLAIQAATPQTPTRMGLLPIPKKSSLTNIAAMFRSNPSSSPPGRTKPVQKAQTPPETYASTTVRLKREKMALDLAMKRRALQHGEISPERVSPEDVEDWEKELWAIDAAQKERTIKEEKRRSQDWKEMEKKRKSDMLRMVYGWQDDAA